MTKSNSRIRKRRRNVESVATNKSLYDDSDQMTLYNSSLVHAVRKQNHNPRKRIQPIPNDDNAATVVMINHSCLLIPAILLAWWYWTKRTAQRAVHGLITFAHGGESSTNNTTTLCSCAGTDTDNDVGYEVSPSANHPATRYTVSSSRTASPTATGQNHNQGYEFQYQSWREEDDNVLPGASSSSSSAGSTNFRFINWMKRSSTKTSRSTRHKVRNTTLHHLQNHRSNNNNDNNNENIVNNSEAATTSTERRQQQSKTHSANLNANNSEIGFAQQLQYQDTNKNSTVKAMQNDAIQSNTATVAQAVVV